jgi:hypothetical protein
MELVEIRRIAASIEALCAAVLDCPSDEGLCDQLYDGLGAKNSGLFFPGDREPAYLRGLANQASILSGFVQESIEARRGDSNPIPIERVSIRMVQNLRRVLADIVAYRG